MEYKYISNILTLEEDTLKTTEQVTKFLSLLTCNGWPTHIAERDDPKQ